MPGCDSIPFLSQVKSLVQVITGDKEGARRTQENFSRECPGVSQVRSLVELAANDEKAALETQRRFLGTMSDFANGIPVVGHLKGGIHHLAGDHKGGNQALKAATRTAAVMGAGAAAAVTTGGLMAIPAGIAAGTTFDTVDSIIHDEPRGIIAAVDNAVNETNGGNVFEATMAVAGDSMAGYSGGKIGTKCATNYKLGQLESKLEAMSNQMTDSIGSNGGMTCGQSIALGNEMKALNAQINTIKYGPPVNVDSVKGEFNPAATAAYKQAAAKPSPVLPISGLDYSEKITYIRTDENEAFSADYYEGEECKGDTEEKRAKAESYKTQKSNGKTFDKKYSPYQLTTVEEVEKIGDGDSDRDPHSINLKRTCQLIVRLRFLLVRMPSQFNYTSAMLMNNPRQGLLHSFFRHFKQWARLIALDDILEKLKPIRARLNQIFKGRNEKEIEALIYQLEKDLKSLSDDVRNDIHLALLRVQCKILRFIQENITYSSYLGEGINNKGQMQVGFDIGNGQVMVVAVGKELYDQSFPQDGRKVRAIITVFIMDKKDFEKRKTTKMF